MNEIRLARAARVLKKLERLDEKKVVLHGSSRRSGRLAPKKPYTHVKNKVFHRRGVYATAVVEVAIMYAIIPGDFRWKFAFEDGKIHLGLPAEGFDLYGGFVHVCARKKFVAREGPLVLSSSRPIRTPTALRIDPITIEIFRRRGAIKFVPVD